MAECINENLLNSVPEAQSPVTIDDLFNNYERAYYFKKMDAFIGELFANYVKDEGWTISDLEDEDKLRRLYLGLQGHIENYLIDYSNGDREISEKAAEDLEKIYDNFTLFANEHKTYNNLANTKDFQIEDEDLEKEEDVEGNQDNSSQEPNEEMNSTEEEKDENLHKESYNDLQKSPLELASNEIKILFRILLAAEYVNGQVQVKLDENGLPSPAETSVVWNMLLERTSFQKNEKKLRELLLSEDLYKIIPEAKFVADILSLPKFERTRDMSFSEITQWISFYHTFSKPKIPIKSGFISEENSFILNDEILGNKLKIARQWTSNFVSSDVEKNNNLVIISETGRRFLQGVSSIPAVGESFQSKIDFLDFIGVKFSSRDTYSSQEQIEFTNLINEITPKLYEGLRKRLEKEGTQIYEPLVTLAKKEKNIFSERENINRLVNWESKYSRISPTLSSRNANGELQYLINQDSQLSQVVYDLNNSDTLDKLMETSSFINAKYNPLFYQSKVIETLFDESGNKRKGVKLDLDLFSGFKVQKDGKTKVKLLRDLSDKNKLLFDFYSFLTDGRTDVMRTETSHSFYSLRMSQNNKPLFINSNINGFQKSFFENKSFERQILKYLSGEIERIQSYKEKKKENPSLPDSYKEFLIFDKLLPKLQEDLKKQEPENIEPELIREFKRQYENILKEKLKEFDTLKENLEITEEELYPVQLANLNRDSLKRAFIAGTLIQNIEFTILFSGDPLFYKDLHKRLKGLSSTGNALASFEALELYYNSQEYKDYASKYSAASAYNTTEKDNSKSYKSQVLRDKIGGTTKNRPFYYTSNVVIGEMQDSVLQRDGYLSKSYETEALQESLKDAKDVKTADGQGWGNIDFIKEVLQRSNYWTKEMDVAYEYEGLFLRAVVLKQKLTAHENYKFSQLEEKIMKDPNKYAIPVIKMTYWGNVENSTVDAKVYDKFSVAPILPSAYYNHPNMMTLLEDMVKGKYGYVKYKSGTKGFVTNVYDDLKNANPDILSTSLLKVQIKPSSEQKTSTSIPTQFLKLVFSNLFSNGQAVNEDVQNLFNKYVNILKDIQSVQTEKLLNNLGISYEIDEQAQFKTKFDIDKIRGKLVDRAKQQGYNSNIISAIQEANEFEASGYLKEINDLIAGMMDKTLRRFKLKGGDFVLVSNAEMSPLKWYKYSRTGVEACQCRITMTKEHSKLLNLIHPDGTKIETIFRLNQSLKNEEWVKAHEEEITVVLDRVPTQGPNSMDVAIVAEFLSPTVGNVVILPDEIVYKSGTDFDYDKEKVILPSLTSTGRVIKNIENTDEKIEAVKTERKELTDELFRITRNKNTKSDNETLNEVKQYINDLKSLLKSNKFDEIKDDSKSIQEIKNIYAQLFRLDIIKSGLDEKIEQFEKDRVDETFIIPLQEEFDNVREEADQLINDLDKKINQYKNREIVRVVNEGYRFRNKIVTLLQMKNKEFESKANELISVYKDVLLLPEMFNELVLPNSTRFIKPLAISSGENTDFDLSLPQGSLVFDYLENLKVFKTFFSAKTLLGPFAVDNTFQQLFTHLGININDTYYTLSSKGKIQENYIQNLILSQEEFAKVKDGQKILISLKEDIEGYVKQHWNSESINATVDAAKDPFFSLMRVLWENIGVVNFMKNQGIPFERIIDFINHPALVEYYTYRQNGLSKKDAWIKIAQNRLGFNYKIENIKKAAVWEDRAKEYKELSREQLIQRRILGPDEYLVSIDKESENRWIPTVERRVIFGKEKYDFWKLTLIFKAIDTQDFSILGKKFPEQILNKVEPFVTFGEISVDRIKEIAQPQNDRVKNRKNLSVEERRTLYSDELKVLAHFYQMDKHNNTYRDFQKLYNFDTTKTGTLIDVYRKEMLREKVGESGLFSKEDLEKMDEQSILSAYINLRTQKEIFENIFPFLANIETQQTLTELFSSYLNNFEIFKTSKDIRTMPSVIYSDFITSIVFNYGTYEGKNIFERGRDLMIKRNRETLTLIDRFANLRKRTEYKELAQEYPILTMFRSDKKIIGDNSDPNTGRPVEIHNVAFDKDPNQTQLEQESYIEQFRRLYNYKGENQEFNEQFHNFIKDLFFVGIAQSGFSKTNIGFAEFIPYEFAKQIYKDAFDKYKQLTQDQKTQYVNTFSSYFKNNNAKYFPYTEEIEINDVEEENIITRPNKNNYSNRIKFYKWAAPKQGRVIIPPKVEKGRYVNYQGTPYIVTQQNTNGTWQIYNPTLEGNEAKISVKEENLKPLREKAVFVTYNKTDYMVTPKDVIISLKSNSSMKWPENNKNRVNIINLAKEERQKVQPEPFVALTTQPIITTPTSNINTSTDVAEQIYSQLGNKTKSENVQIKSVYQQEGVNYAKSIDGVFSLRVNNSSQHFGNPFSSVKSEIAKGLIATNSTKESVTKYIDWIINSQDERAKWIREQLKSGILKGKPVIYYKELGEPSHATALDYLINKYNWNTSTDVEQILFEEEQSTGYKERTIKNASADATIAIAYDFNSAGEKLTKSSVLNQGKLYLPVSTDVFASGNDINMTAGIIARELNKLPKNKISLNIAGNGIYTLKGTMTQTAADNFTLELLQKVIERLNPEKKIVSLRTGGQTGFDEAGAKAGIKLGIPTKILAPKGWKFRDITGIDISNEQMFKERFKTTSTDTNTISPEGKKPIDLTDEDCIP